MRRTTTPPSASSNPTLRLVALQLGSAFCLAVTVRFFAAFVSHHEPVVDVYTFWTWARILDAGLDPYSLEVSPANYPPPWIYLCWFCLKLSQATGLSFDLVMEWFVSLIDSATVFPIGLVALALGATSNQAYGAILTYALNPVALLIASFHAQNDPIVVGLLMWACWLLVSRPVLFADELGALLVGFTLVIKPIAILFVPLLLVAVAGWLRRLWCVALVLLPSALFWLPDLVDRPEFVLRTLTGYGGVPDFGFVGIFNAWRNLGLGSSGINMGLEFPWWYRPFCVAVLAIIWWRLRRANLMQQIVGVLLGLYLIYGNLAAQYLIWIVPFASALRSRHLLAVSILSAITLVAFYQLHHPAILSGTHGTRVPLPITVPQWSGIFLFAHTWLYVKWIRWLVELLGARATANEGN